MTLSCFVMVCVDIGDLSSRKWRSQLKDIDDGLSDDPTGRPKIDETESDKLEWLEWSQLDADDMFWRELDPF